MTVGRVAQKPDTRSLYTEASWSASMNSRQCGASAWNLRCWGSLSVVALFIAFSTTPGHAQNYQFENGLRGGPITAAEWRTLPEYCLDTQGFKYGRGGSPNSAKWVALLGDTFWDLHHYCLSIVDFNRAQRAGYARIDRDWFVGDALAGFEYVIERMPEHYVLEPEIYTYVGRTYLLTNATEKAAAAFARAQKAKPDYWPAYSWWAAYLSTHGEKAKARAIVDAGLAQDPGSRTLQSMKRELSVTSKKP